VLGAHGQGVYTCEDRGAGDCADRGVRVGVLEEDGFFGESIDARGLCLFVSVAAQPVGGVVFADDPEDIGFLLGGERQKKYEWEKEFFHFRKLKFREQSKSLLA